MRALLLTREFPPDVYGGAGVHVEYLARELRKRIDLDVYCFGGAREGATGFEPWGELEDANATLRTMSVDLAMAADAAGAQVVHSHTWYAIFGGHLTKLLHRIPHVVTTHSLEPMRPWKAEQLGAGGYALSSFCERTGIEGADAVVAVSAAMRTDVQAAYPAVEGGRIEVIYNGIDTEQYTPDHATDALERYGVRVGVPTALFVGRITRQKGIVHLVEAARSFSPGVQVVLCAGAPDEPEIERATREGIERLRAERDDVVWIEAMVPKEHVIQLQTHATVFCVPSIYEPLGIVNLEAMACETPVVASTVGGIPEVVRDGETGLLVDVELGPGGDPVDPRRFAADFAARVNELIADPVRAKRLGLAGRRRAIERFSWSAIADETVALYERLAG
ncbi:MAG TPA: glycogen synthase [Gaiellaceae bacterium]|nr:glycogen synthase [Gaiellaceae bacterium]